MTTSPTRHSQRKVRVMSALPAQGGSRAEGRAPSEAHSRIWLPRGYPRAGGAGDPRSQLPLPGRGQGRPPLPTRICSPGSELTRPPARLLELKLCVSNGNEPRASSLLPRPSQLA